MIPKLRSDGTLSSGIHQATIDEILATFPPANQQRQILNDSLQRAVEELRRLDPSMIIYIDGSYVTRKAGPNDIDILLITTQYNTQDILTYLDQNCPVEVVSLGIYAEPNTPNTMLDFFTTTRTGQAKGIIVLI